MKTIIQRVKDIRATSDTINNQINKSYCLLVGVGQNSTEEDVEAIAKKTTHAHLSKGEDDKLDLNIQQAEGKILLASQFTIYADVKKGSRPGFSSSRTPEQAKDLYRRFNEELGGYGLIVKTGEFGTYMNVEISNGGPAALIYES